MKRKIRYDRIAGVFFILFWVWVLASFIDVNLHNQPFTAGYQHFADWNLFIWAFDAIFPAETSRFSPLKRAAGSLQDIKAVKYTPRPPGDLHKNLQLLRCRFVHFANRLFCRNVI